MDALCKNLLKKLCKIIFKVNLPHGAIGRYRVIITVCRGYLDAVVPVSRPPGVRPRRIGLYRQGSKHIPVHVYTDIELTLRRPELGVLFYWV